MKSEKDLKVLLGSIRPELKKGSFVFCSISEKHLKHLSMKIIMQFKEKESITIVAEKKEADKNSLYYKSVWSLITLGVHSDSEVVGFLAEISSRLAKARICINVVSAHHHDHLFVPADKAGKAMQILKGLTKE